MIGHRVAVVTGAASGIGAATALRLAKAGCRVVVAYRSNSSGAEAVVAACREIGSDAAAEICDIAEDQHCRALAQAVLGRWGRIDLLVNNAGTTRFAPASDLEALDAAAFRHILDVNLIGTYQMTRAAEPALRAAGGAIVNISSHSAFSGLGSSSAYAASKGALNTLTLALARALAPHVRVNALCPGFVDTDWMAPALDEVALAQFKDHSAGIAPLGRIVTPEDVAEAVEWLGLGGPSITGQFLTIDAGTHLTVASPV